jgi:hypothetical protein
MTAPLSTNGLIMPPGFPVSYYEPIDKASNRAPTPQIRRTNILSGHGMHSRIGTYTNLHGP